MNYDAIGRILSLLRVGVKRSRTGFFAMSSLMRPLVFPIVSILALLAPMLAACDESIQIPGMGSSEERLIGAWGSCAFDQRYVDQDPSLAGEDSGLLSFQPNGDLDDLSPAGFGYPRFLRESGPDQMRWAPLKDGRFVFAFAGDGGIYFFFASVNGDRLLIESERVEGVVVTCRRARSTGTTP
jgi:hypothetical protein